MRVNLWSPVYLRVICSRNSLDTKDATTKEGLHRRWLSIESSLRCQIRGILINTLGSSIYEVGDTAAQVIAKIAAIEIPINELSCLLGKQATLNTLEYVCKEIYQNDLLHEANRAEVKGMDYILEKMCEAATAKETDIRKAAFKWIASIASTYYEALEPHMETIYELTTNIEDKDNVPEAIEFWTGICNVEIRLTGDSYPHYRFVDSAKYALVPKLQETLLKEGGNGICKLSKAGGECLGLAGDSIVRLVMPFVLDNLSMDDAVSREAGAYILEGPSVEELYRMVLVVLHMLIEAMGDENSHVKETISRIFKLLHSPATGFSVISPAKLERIIEEDSPDVAEKVCGAIFYFARGYDGFKNDSSVLTLFFREIIDSLIATGERTDKNDLKLRFAAYKTLNEVVRCSNTIETSHIVQRQLLRKVMDILRQTLEVPIDDTKNQEEQLGLLCGVLLVVIQKLSSTEKTKPSISKAADDIMHLLMKVFDYSTTVHKEAMLATGALVYAIGQEFNKYIVDFSKFLQMGLQNTKEYQVCTISVGVVSEICRALGGEMLPYCDDIMELLFKNLSTGDLLIMPSIFTCFGDMARAIGKKFEKHVDSVMVRMKEAVEVCGQIDVNNEKMVKYGKQLMMSILEGYSGIWQVIKTLEGDSKLTHAPQLLKFIEVVVKDPHRDERMGKEVVTLLGDIAIALGDISVFNLKMSS